MALSKEEFVKLDTEIDENQKAILVYLAEVHHKNPQNPWVNIETLGAQIGGFTGRVQAQTAVLQLHNLELIGYRPRNLKEVAISQKGLLYIKSHKPQSKSFRIKYSTKTWVVFSLVITILGGLIVALITGWRPW